jgi:2-polyprenyl-6-methoxyphenol hydroxylase-like FAD-dependent oxidoreductase
MTDNSYSAVVIGASVAGLLAASALSDRFGRVLILEREVLPPPGQGRKAVPQGKHVHALLPGGLAAIEQLLPGFQAELVAGGAVRCDSMQEIRFVASGHEITREAASATNILASRPYIEGHLRRRVLELPNVTLLDGTAVRGLVANPDRTRVAGVRLSDMRLRDEVVTCDLVVVATGRAGQLPAWLNALGLRAPAEEELTVDIRYASRHFAIPDGYLGQDKLILIGAEPGRPRGMGLFAQEDDTWLLTLFGYGKAHKPPTEDAGYWKFLASVAPADVLAAVAAGQPLDEVVTYTFPASRRRRYERLRRFPAGLVALGDAISSFNPVYGQGMSVAALQAIALRGALTSGASRLSQRYFKATRRIVDTAWDLAIGSDLSLPEVEGPRSILTRLSNAWVERILQAAEDDACVAEAFGSVTDLLAPPTVLMQPRLIWRVVRNRGEKQADKAKIARRVSRHPTTANVADLASAPMRPHRGRGQHDDHKVG